MKRLHHRQSRPYISIRCSGNFHNSHALSQWTSCDTEPGHTSSSQISVHFNLISRIPRSLLNCQQCQVGSWALLRSTKKTREYSKVRARLRKSSRIYVIKSCEIRDPRRQFLTSRLHRRIIPRWIWAREQPQAPIGPFDPFELLFSDVISNIGVGVPRELDAPEVINQKMIM